MINGAFLGAGVDENGNPILIKVNDQSHLPITADDIPDLDASKITTGTFDPDRLGSGTQNAYTFLNGAQAYSSPLTGFIINPMAYGAVGDGVTDDRAAIMSAIAVATTLKGTVEFPQGYRFYISKYIGIIDSPDVRIVGYGATLIHPGAVLTVNAPATDSNATLAAHVLSGFFVLRSDRVSIEGFYFEDASDITEIVGAYWGAGVYGRESSDLHVTHCHYRGRSTLFISDESDTLTTGGVVAFCTSYGPRRPVNPADDTTIFCCRFEVPTTSDYNRVGSTGSSHAIYTFAGRSNVKIISCHFENVREYGVKFSGSSLAINNCIVANCTFANNYRSGVFFGADDVQDHSALVVTGNTFYNCVVNTADGVVVVYGSRTVIINNNTFYWDTLPSTPTGRFGIQVERYSSSSQAVESVLIENNIFECRLETSYVTSAASVLAYAINCIDIGYGRVDANSKNYSGGVSIRGNHIAVGTVAITCLRCMCPIVENNTISNIATFFTGGGNRMPIIRHNTEILGPQDGTNAKIRIVSDSWPIIYENVTSGRHRASSSAATNIVAGKGFTTSDAAGGSTLVDFPLLGIRGKAATTDGRSEIVFAYGDGWTDGDTVVLNGGTTYTYQGTSPGANQFNTIAGLIALLDAQAGFDAADYGATWSVVTNHIRVRQIATNSSFTMTITTARRTAGVGLINGTGANTSLLFSVGGQATASRTHIWSPMVQMNSWIGLTPIESTAAALMASSGFYEVAALRTADNDGAVTGMEVGTTAGTEQWRWALR